MRKILGEPTVRRQAIVLFSSGQVGEESPIHCQIGTREVVDVEHVEHPPKLYCKWFDRS